LLSDIFQWIQRESVERHNNTFKVNGTSVGLFPFNLQWVFKIGIDQVTFGPIDLISDPMADGVGIACAERDSITAVIWASGSARRQRNGDR
jgi:hypothetical protein